MSESSDKSRQELLQEALKLKDEEIALLNTDMESISQSFRQTMQPVVQQQETLQDSQEKAQLAEHEALDVSAMKEETKAFKGKGTH